MKIIRFMTVIITAAIATATLAGGVPVTPELMNKLEEAGAKQKSVQSNATQKYDARALQAINTIDSHGGNVVILTKSTTSLDSSGPDYYVSGPKGGVVEVSSTRIDEGGKFGTVEKSISYVPAGSSTGSTKIVEIPYADAKAAKILANDKIENESKIETAAKVEAAKDFSVRRGHVTQGSGFTTLE